MSLTKTKISSRLTPLFLALAAVPALAQDGAEGAPPPGLFGGNFMFIMIAMFAIIYFIMIRPEQKKQKQRQAMLSALKKGDKVVTIGGIVGVITAVKDTSYVVKSGDGSSLEFTKSAIANVVNGTDASGNVSAETLDKESR